MEKTGGIKREWRGFKFRVILILMLGVGASLILSGCGTQPEAKVKVDTNSGTPPMEQKQSNSTPEPTPNGGVSMSGNSTSQAAVGTASLSPESMISASQLDSGIKEKKDWAVIDVRETNEFATGHVPTSTNIPLGKLEQNLNQFPKNKEIILVCLNGSRSFTAWQSLVGKGYDPHKVKVLVGGMEQWKNLGSGEVTDSIGGC